MSLDSTLSPWDRTCLAVSLLSVDPGLGGAVVRARAGPVRDRFAALLSALPQPIVRLHPTMGDDVLFDGFDLSATLQSGQFVVQKGLLSRRGTRLLTMAERTTSQLAARLALALEQSSDMPMIAFDESAGDDEGIPPAIAERLAFDIDLSEIAIADAQPPEPTATPAHGPAQNGRSDIDRLCATAVAFGIDSLRAPLQALRTARAHAQLNGRAETSEVDLEVAVQMVFAHRATRIPEPQDDPPPPPPETEPNKGESDENSAMDIPQEILLEAVMAQLPAGLLAKLAAQRNRLAKGSGAGAKQRGNRRGRPLPAKAGRKSDGATIDVFATLRAAAPWQPLRKRDNGRTGIQIRASDLRIKQFETRSDRLLIFAVDASGSAALARLAEAKGAVELLLGEAYARRDHVALIAFRGDNAEVLLPPTRSLVQTKRRLAELPGGGGTPLAAGMQTALEQALLAKRRGLTPTICVLTDGRANVAKDGSADRPRAAQDARDMARLIFAQGIAGLVIDTSRRAEPQLRDLADLMGATYVPMPRADAHGMSKAVSAALDA